MGRLAQTALARLVIAMSPENILVPSRRLWLTTLRRPCLAHPVIPDSMEGNLWGSANRFPIWKAAPFFVWPPAQNAATLELFSFHAMRARDGCWAQ